MQSRLTTVLTAQSRRGARIHKPRDHDLIRSRTLNRLSHPGAPGASNFRSASIYPSVTFPSFDSERKQAELDLPFMVRIGSGDLIRKVSLGLVQTIASWARIGPITCPFLQLCEGELLEWWIFKLFTACVKAENWNKITNLVARLSLYHLALGTRLHHHISMDYCWI